MSMREFFTATDELREALAKFNSSSAIPTTARAPAARMRVVGNDIINSRDQLAKAYATAFAWGQDDLNRSRNGFPQDSIPGYRETVQKLAHGAEPDAADKAIMAEGQRVAQVAFEGEGRWHHSDGFQAQRQSWVEFANQLKSLVFNLRSLQDEALKVLLGVMGNPSGKGTSMQVAISKETHPAFEWITSISGYVAWFEEMRNLRNDLKTGLGFSTAAWSGGVAIAYATSMKDGITNVTIGQRQVGLEWVANSIRMSAQLLNVVAERMAGSEVQTALPLSETRKEDQK